MPTLGSVVVATAHHAIRPMEVATVTRIAIQGATAVGILVQSTALNEVRTLVLCLKGMARFPFKCSM